VLTLFLLTKGAKSQNHFNTGYSKEYKNSYSDSIRRIYIYPTKEGSEVINLYSDSLFSFHEYNASEKNGRFGAGRWSVISDSVLILTSDKSVTNFVFSRSKRSNDLKYNRIIEIDLRVLIKNNLIVIPLASSRSEFGRQKNR